MSRILIDAFLEEVALVDPQDVVDHAARPAPRRRAGSRSWSPGIGAVLEDFARPPPTPAARRTPCSSRCTRT